MLPVPSTSSVTEARLMSFLACHVPNVIRAPAHCARFGEIRSETRFSCIPCNKFQPIDSRAPENLETANANYHMLIDDGDSDGGKLWK